MTTEEQVCIILGGWSPGPLPVLMEALRHRGLRCRHVSIPMPPCGCFWLINPFVPMLFVLLPWATLVACDAAAEVSAALVVAVAAAAAVLARLCVAALVRFSVAHGIFNAQRHIRTGRVAFVVGFSWGGGVAHELARRHALPTLLLAPTTVLNCTYALAAPGRVDPSRAAVVLARGDPFTPPATTALYERLGVDVAAVRDDHSLNGRDAYEAILDAVERLLPARPLLGAPAT